MQTFQQLSVEKAYFTQEEILDHLEKSPALWLTSNRSLEDYRDRSDPTKFLNELTDRVNLCVEYLEKFTNPLKNAPANGSGNSYALKHRVEEYINAKHLDPVDYWIPVGVLTLAASLYGLRVIGLSNFPQSRNATICCRDLGWRSLYQPPKTEKEIKAPVRHLTEDDYLEMELQDSLLWNPINDGDCPGFAGD